MIRLTSFLASLLVSLFSYAQVDTEFWFAAPEVTAGHGDRPVLLRISTLDQAALVTVVQPARGNVKILLSFPVVTISPVF